MADPFAAYPTAPAGTPGVSPPPATLPDDPFAAYPLAPQQRPQEPRSASGVVESLQAGFQASAPGLAWRGRLPDLVINPEHSAWWERALSGVAQIGMELPLMVGGAIVGAPAGAAVGTAVAPGPGTAAGSLLGAGAGMGIVPAAIRESLIQAYKSGEIKTAGEFWNAVREVATTAAKEGAINAAGMGLGSMAARAAGTSLVPIIGKAISVPTATAAIAGADITAQIATMATMPAALQGRLPDLQEILDAAVLVGGLHLAGVTASRITSTYIRTGKTPAEQVADAQRDPEIARDLSTPPEADTTNKPSVLTRKQANELANDSAFNGDLEEGLNRVFLSEEGPEQTRLSNIGFTADEIAALERVGMATAGVMNRQQYGRWIDERSARLANKSTLLAPEYVPPVRAEMLKVQENLFTETARLGEMEAKEATTPLTDMERIEFNTLKAKVLDLEKQLTTGAPELARTPTYTADQFVEARSMADQRLVELTEKASTDRLNDIERAERVFLTNSLERPDALARHFGFEPQIMVRPSAAQMDVSAQKIYDDVLRMAKDADEARRTAGNEPLGDDHAQAIAALVRARIRTRAERLGVLPEALYNERPVKIADETAALDAATKIEQPAPAPELGPPVEVDLFGDPIQTPTDAPAERMQIADLATQEVPLANLVLSKEVPQFKNAANREGVVVPLGGMFDRTGVGPIQVWERLDGTLEVISGRHRLDLARRSGEETIPAQIHREADGFTAKQAATLDAQLNIREEQGSVADYAQYFKDAEIGKDAADKLGLLARAKGRAGFAIARDASPDLLASHRAGRLTDEAALSISAAAPGSARLQALGIAAVQDGKSILYATNLMRSVDLMAAERMAAGQQGDIFGFDDSALREASSMAKKAASKQRQISEQIAAVSGASKRPELARKMGVNVEDPAAVQAKIIELKNEQYLWDNWPLYPELVAKLRDPSLKQDDIPMLPETPAEAAARDRDAAQAAMREFAAGEQIAPAGWDVADTSVGNRPTNQQGFDITQSMKDKATEGLPLFQQRDQMHRGSYDIAENLITIMGNADKSTVVHELAHSWLEEMKTDAARPDAVDQIKADWDILRRELAIGEDGAISRASHEQFARSVERYTADGDAPSVELRGVFERFKQWLLEIYKDLRNLNVEINPELRSVLDRMLATDEEIRLAREMNIPRAYVPEATAIKAAEIVPPPAARRKIEPGFKAEQASMQPFADEIPPGPGEAPDNIHVNYAYINSPDDVKLAMQRMAEIDQTNIQTQRGGTEGVKSWAEANAEQARYLNDILGGNEDTLHLFEPRDPNAPQVDARLGILKKLAVGAAKDSARLRDVVLEAGHDATVRQQLEYMGSIERARMIQAEFLGERAAVARALNALKDTTEGTGEIARMLEVIGLGETDGTLYQATRTPAEEQAYLKAKLDEILQNYRGKTVLDIAKLHKEIGTLKGSFKFTEEVSKATKWDMVVEGWKSGLLSGPVTHTTNLFGTGAFMAMRAPVDALSAIIGMARGASPGIGESDRASMSEAVARITGMMGGVQDGLKLAAATFRLDDPTGKTEAYRTAIPGRAGEIIRIPLRLMGAEDALVSSMYQRGELRTLAIRQAFDENMNPGTREFADRVQQLVDSPTEDMKVAAETAATRMTFNAPLGEKGVALQLFVAKWNLQWMIPFIRTPINIAKEMARMSPFAPIVGEWRADIAKGGVARDRALAEIALGTSVMGITMAYAFAGNISGSTGPDPGKNRGKAGVWQPNSILIGDTWYEYGRIQPTGTLMVLAADIAAVWDHMTEEEKDKIPKMLAIAFSNAVTNQTFLQGITNFVNAMGDPTRFAPKFLQGLAGSVVPNIIAQPTAMADPVVREVNSMLDAVQARLPGFRQNLLPSRDWLGEPRPARERLGVILPSRTLEVSDDKVRLEAARLDISMAAPPRKTHIGKGTGKLGDVQLTPEEIDTFEKVGGQFAHQILTNVVNAPDYDKIPDMVKRRIYSNVLTASHRIAAVAALPMEKRLQYLQSITEKVVQELTPSDQ